MRLAREAEAEGVIDDDRARGRERPRGVSGVRRDHGSVSRSEDPLLAIDRERNLALDYVPDLFLDMVVLVEREGIGGDVVVGKGHVL